MEAELGGPRRPLIRLLARRSTIYAVGDLFSKGPEFLLLPLYAFFLTPAEYGIVSLATVVTVILRPTLSMGMQAAALKCYYDFATELERRRFYGSLLAFYVGGGGLLYLFLDQTGPFLVGNLVQSVPFDPYLRMAVWTAFVGATVIELPKEILRAKGRAGPYGLLTAGVTVVSGAFTVWLVVIEQRGAEGAILANLLGNVLVGAVSAWFLIRYVKLSVNLRYVAQALVFSAPLIPHFLAHWVLSASDRLILERFVSIEDVGRYTVGYVIGWSLSIVKMAITNAMIPLYGALRTHAAAGPSKVAELTTYYVVVIAYTGMAITLFGREIVDLLASEDYAGAAQVVPWVVLGAFALALYNPSVQVLNIVLGRSRVIAVSTVLAALTNIALNLLVIPYLGIVGAAMTTAASYTLLALGAYWFAQRAFPISYEYRRILIIIALLLTCTLVAILLEGSTGTKIVLVKVGVLGATVFVLRAVRFLKPRELEFLRQNSGWVRWASNRH